MLKILPRRNPRRAREKPIRYARFLLPTPRVARNTPEQERMLVNMFVSLCELSLILIGCILWQHYAESLRQIGTPAASTELLACRTRTHNANKPIRHGGSWKTAPLVVRFFLLGVFAAFMSNIPRVLALPYERFNATRAEEDTNIDTTVPTPCKLQTTGGNWRVQDQDFPGFHDARQHHALASALAVRQRGI